MVKRASQGKKLKQTMTIMQRADHDDLVDDTLDPRAHEEKRELVTGPVEELVAISINVNNPSKVLKLGRIWQMRPDKLSPRSS